MNYVLMTMNVLGLDNDDENSELVADDLQKIDPALHKEFVFFV